MANEIVDFLKRIPYFGRLSAPTLADVAGRASLRSYARRELILLEGEPAQAVYFVVSGQVRVYKVSAGGREQVLDRLGPGAALNLVPVLDGAPNPASATAANAVTLCAIPRDDFLAAIRHYPPLAEAVLADLATRLRRFAALVEDLSFRTVRARLARLLLRQAAQPGRRFTQAEMAAELGTVRDVVGRLMAELQDEGLVAVERHRIIVKDRPALEAMAEV
ncbi:MAG TPA: Crp/Fnr family transcriptional regulator [Anaerolineae bacterium]|nr:Crp/Fnr family transcriptional regulator [Anaerolineae bacterium]HOG45575.1 Crp/Fnr family transcriptional regulator [Anaerolineae bacterium]HOQ98938.1 Crp/Fnr family transcriptional regulator [Anaerolineae bacterium]HPL26534.1 Crp/Fnr family transcriptional regulator [Anaerolineae bacterium]